MNFTVIERSGNKARILDQTQLPAKVIYNEYDDYRDIITSIKKLEIRGAPAIGITAAYAVVLAARRHLMASPREWQDGVLQDIQLLAAARPTAVNLVWALARMQRCLATAGGNPVAALLDEARRIHAEDIAANRRMGEAGAALIGEGSAVLTHCNAGALATGGYGTALGVIRSAWTAGKLRQVYAGETRPWLQGARLTAWELLRDDIPVTLLSDSAAALLMQQKRVQWVIVGADRVAANGDVINKIGTYQLAVACRYHGVGMMVVAPLSTLDRETPTGQQVTIEQRSPDEVLQLAGRRIAAQGATAWNPVFDVTPAGLVDYLVTEAGVVAAPDREKLAALPDSQYGPL